MNLLGDGLSILREGNGFMGGSVPPQRQSR
jgi:hypothetical protein